MQGIIIISLLLNLKTLVFMSPMPLQQDVLQVQKVKDFTPDANADKVAWQQTDWTSLQLMDNPANPYETKVKMCYSDKGIYVLAHCDDKKITTKYKTDQGDIWNGDVFEVFLQTDADNPLYFEYEINALGTELAILVPNNEGDFFGWQPWHYEGDRKVVKAVKIHGGVQEPHADINGWTAEIFIPYTLFKALKNVPPQPGTTWKGNFYRMDYDTGERIKWGWKTVDHTFHEYKKFGTILFK